MRDRTKWYIRVTEDIYLLCTQTTQVNLRVPHATHQALKAESAHTGIPINLLINNLIYAQYRDTYPDGPIPMPDKGTLA